MTAVSALQCVEKGLLGLDDPIDTVLPEFRDPRILTGFDEAEKPILKPASKLPTLRHLLTHSSGIGYSGMDPLLVKWWAQQGNQPDMVNTSIKYSYTFPLIFEPGQGWSYGAGLDWAGQMVERVNDGIRLGEYMKKNIWDELGMKSTTFRPTLDPEIMKRACAKPWRNAETGILEPDQTGIFPIEHEPTDDYGGNGSYTSAEDYIQVLKSLLTNDGTLLKPETRDLLLKPSLGSEAKAMLREQYSGPFGPFLTYGFPNPGEDGIEYEYALGGSVIVNEEGMKGRADKGMISWGGFPNSYWFIDDKRGVAGVYAAHVYPPGDKPTQNLFKLWHMGVYELAGKPENIK